MGAEVDLEVRTEIRDGYIFVWQHGAVTTEDQLAEMQGNIKAAMDQAGTRRVMFDNRETDSPDEWLRASMWTWLSENIGRAALIQNEPRNIKRAERTGERNRIVIRAFHDAEAAEAWLMGS